VAEVILTADITGLVLSGGQGLRMGGLDKGLQNLHGQALALRCLERLAPQVAQLAVNANRHLDDYARWPCEVWPDPQEAGEFSGPLAGFLAGLIRCQTPFLCTVPCDSPLFPLDLVRRMALSLSQADANIAVAAAMEDDRVLRAQPVFCLMKTEVRESLRAFLRSGRRKIDAWTATERTVLVRFDQPGDDPRAFVNVNTLEQLDQLERELPP
jgi:molybdopterin-guanine dinucleotide biosynthesis protein A